LFRLYLIFSNNKYRGILKRSISSGTSNRGHQPHQNGTTFMQHFRLKDLAPYLFMKVPAILSSVQWRSIENRVRRQY